jgi:hypothetical protein
MLHVATVHWHDERWLAPQLRYFERYLPEHRVFASLNGIDIDRWGPSFHYAADLDGPHHVKLNELADLAARDADPDDLLLFIDSDAFPIAPVDRSLLGGTPLAAVRRDENMGEQQPHPCFCLTTVGFWKEIDGDWARGYEWEASNGEMVSDGGGNLLRILRERNIEWRPLLRSNRVELDPLWFAVYGDAVYHHGAGSRPMISFASNLEWRRALRLIDDECVIPKAIPFARRVERSIRYRWKNRAFEREKAEYARRSQELSDRVFGWIETDPDFVNRFLDPSAASA